MRVVDAQETRLPFGADQSIFRQGAAAAKQGIQEKEKEVVYCSAASCLLALGPASLLDPVPSDCIRFPPSTPSSTASVPDI